VALVQNLATASCTDSPMYSGQNRDFTTPSDRRYCTTAVDSKGLWDGKGNNNTEPPSHSFAHTTSTRDCPLQHPHPQG
jgi:hypothetical protein